MDNTVLRAVASVVVLCLSVGAYVVALAPDAGAAPRSERDPFVLEAFPHDSPAVSFWDSWGARRSGGRRHMGIDIMSPRGTEIVAVADGTVLDYGRQRLSGYFIRLDHGGGWTTTFMHLNNDTLGTDDGKGGAWTAIHPLISRGDRVVAGQVIGYVGDSGNAEGTRPHTHFEIALEGDTINPYPFLVDVWERRHASPVHALMPR